MWYLLTFELTDFISLEIKEAKTKMRWQGKEENLDVYNVNAHEKDYRTNLIHEYPATVYGEILDDLQSINPGNFILINFSTVLIKWDDSISSLSAKVDELLSEGDTFFLCPVTGKVASNLPVNIQKAINNVLK